MATAVTLQVCGIFLLLFVPTLYIASRSIRPGRHRGNTLLPPGPKGYPLLGAALSVDPSNPWFTYFQWRKTFGDLVYTRLFSMDVLVINSAKIAGELVERRSNIYSDRPRFPTAEPYGIANGTLLMPYGDTWRLHRRIYHQALNTDAAASYQPMQRARALQLISSLAKDPQHFSVHFYSYSTSIVMSIVYGYDTRPTNDPYVDYAERGTRAIAKAVDPKRAALLRLFPFLLRLPTWIPGSFKAEAAESRKFATGFRKFLFDMALDRMASGTGTPSMISGAVEKNERDGNLPEVTLAIRNTSSVAYGAGSDTTAASLDVFLLAMVLHPEVQRRAQEEIDAVVGSDRLPDFGDRASLPFVEAVIRETTRWHPVVPLGLPHATSTEDMYKGVYIPKGTTVLVNVWGLAHDEEIYPQPFKFNPERFINQDGSLSKDDFPFAFGFGRRICPGRFVASASIWIAVASMLATFDLLKARDDHGNDIDFSPQFGPGPTSRPKPFPCRIVPRKSSSAIRELAIDNI